MTRDEYGAAYEQDFERTVRFLKLHGASGSWPEEIAQAAWVKGWERLSQLRSAGMVLMWVNSIARNIWRSVLRADPTVFGNRNEEFARMTDVVDAAARMTMTWETIEAHRVLDAVSESDRQLLVQRYLHGYSTLELAHESGKSRAAIDTAVLRARRRAAGQYGRPSATTESRTIKRLPNRSQTLATGRTTSSAERKPPAAA